jgi:hypothetical protein
MSLAAIIVATGMTTALAEGPVCPPPEFPLATVEITVITVGSGGSSTTRFVGFGEGTFERASRTGTRETKKFQLKQEDVVAVVNRVDSYGDEEIAVLKDPATVQTQVVHESCGGGVTITVKLGKCTKTARVDPGAPRELTDLVQYLERVANERVVR